MGWSSGESIAVAHRSGRLDRRSLPEHALVGLLIVSLVGASGLLAFTIGLRPPTTSREQAVDAMVTWARDHTEPGATIAFGSHLGYEMALPLRRDHPVRQVRHMTVVSAMSTLPTASRSSASP